MIIDTADFSYKIHQGTDYKIHLDSNSKYYIDMMLVFGAFLSTFYTSLKPAVGIFTIMVAACIYYVSNWIVAQDTVSDSMFEG